MWVLCLLHDNGLSTFTLEGDSYTFPLARHCKAMHPLPCGVLISVSSPSFSRQYGMQYGHAKDR